MHKRTDKEIEDLYLKLTQKLKLNYRNSQLRMILDTYHSFFSGPIVNFSESPTGTGKSLAYLIPAIIFTQDNPGEKVIISTKTLNLQEQLLHIDIPRIEEFFKDEIFPMPPIAVLKGRNNYICGWRLFHKNKKQFSEYEINRFSLRVIAEELIEKSQFLSLGYRYKDWKLAETEDSRDCLREGCPYYKGVKCCSYTAKETAKSANIIIVNHYLLFADLWGRYNGVKESAIPVLEYTNLILDEAHLLEDIITKTFTKEFSNEGVYTLINKVTTQYLVSDTDIEDKIKNSVDKLTNFIKKLPTDEVPLTDDLIYLVMEVVRAIDEYLNFLREISESDINFEAKIKVTATLAYFSDLISVLQMVINRNDSEFIVHKEKHIIKVTLIDYKDILESILFNKNLSLILTSATLAYKNKSSTRHNVFEYPMRSLFLDKFKEPPALIGNIYPKIFDKNKLKFITPSTITDYRSEDYEKQLAFLTQKMVEMNKGSALVLFTSLKRMNNIYKAIKDAISYDIYLPTKDTSKLELIKKFKKNTNSILFGSYSFWEGIDVPGESLTLIIIDKLPFETPSILSNALNNYFGGFKYQCYKTTLKLRQGIGRLIRSENDSGQIVICDSRLTKSGWGKQIFENLN